MRSYSRTAFVLASLVVGATAGGACCGTPCTSNGDCAVNLFCCPNHHECMGDDTKSTAGPDCDACNPAPAPGVALKHCAPDQLGADPVGITFNESLVGYGQDCADIPGGCSADDTIAQFMASYEAGKAANSSLGFALFVDVNDIHTFRADPLHAGVCTGNATADNLTDASGVPGHGGHAATGDTAAHTASIHIFDGGVLPTKELRMEYNLPFTGVDGAEYVMVGTKHMPGSDCLGILSQITTLYTHVYVADPAHPGQPDTARVVRRGVVKIDLVASLKLIASLRLTGGGLLPEIARLEGLAGFGLFLGQDLLNNCVDVNDTLADFHYAWASDGKTGMLLDMIRRHDDTELRLAVFSDTGAPVVHRQMLTVADYHEDPTSTNVTLGPLAMTDAGVYGTVDGVKVGVSFAGLGLGKKTRGNTFLPKAMLPGGIDGWVSTYAPTVISTYGDTGTFANTLGNATLAPGTPLVRTRYTIPVGLKMLRWGMVSASQFAGTDLQIEVVSAPVDLLTTIAHITPIYVFLDGKGYGRDTELNLITSLHSVSADGRLDANNTHRTFSVTVSIHPDDVLTTNITMSCTAPVDRFVLLEKEGSTYIHSTVLGDCTATIKKELVKPKTFFSTGVNLIEIKE